MNILALGYYLLGFVYKKIQIRFKNHYDAGNYASLIKKWSNGLFFPLKDWVISPKKGGKKGSTKV